MSQELEVLHMVTSRLAEAGIPYMVTGSIAMNYYAIPRMTRDIDIVIELSEEDVEETVRLFQGDFYVDREMAQLCEMNDYQPSRLASEKILLFDSHCSSEQSSQL